MSENPYRDPIHSKVAELEERIRVLEKLPPKKDPRPIFNIKDSDDRALVKVFTAIGAGGGMGLLTGGYLSRHHHNGFSTATGGAAGLITAVVCAVLFSR